MEDDNSGAKGIEDTNNNNIADTLKLSTEILKVVQEIHYTIKDSSLKKEELQVLLDYRDKLVNMFK